MRILHTSDWHLGRSLENISRIEEQWEFIDQLCDIADEERIDLVLVAGDVYDSYNPSAAAEELFYYALDRLNDGGGRAVVVIAGNHDNPERLCASNPLASKNGIILLGYPGSRAGVNKYGSAKTGVVDSGAGWLEVGISRCSHTAVIIALPYPSEARLEQLLTRETDEKTLQRAYSDRVGSIISALSRRYRADTVNLALSHLFMNGGKQSESERVLQVGGALTVEPGSPSRPGPFHGPRTPASAAAGQVRTLSRLLFRLPPCLQLFRIRLCKGPLHSRRSAGQAGGYPGAVLKLRQAAQKVGRGERHGRGPKVGRRGKGQKRMD
jgi:exonuclease SbcD